MCLDRFLLPNTVRAAQVVSYNLESSASDARSSRRLFDRPKLAL